MLDERLNEDPFFGVRIVAAKALAKHESDEAYAVLEKSWRKQNDARVRLAVVERVTSRFAEETPRLIAEILDEEHNPAIKAAAIEALGRFHGEESSKEITQQLNSSSFRNELAVAAIAAIRQQNDPAYKDSLIGVLRKRESQFTSRAFGRGLQTLAHVANSLVEKDDVRDFLVNYLNHPKTTIRTSAMNGLGMLGDSSAISVLEAFSGSSDERISRAARQALGKLREAKPTAPKELVELRKEMAALKKSSEKLQTQIEEIRTQLQARE